jgi:hypothetical protein
MSEFDRIRSRMGNGALPNGPSYRLCRDVGAMREQQAKGNEMPIVNSVEKGVVATNGA